MLALVAPLSLVRAQDTPGPDWEPTALGSPVERLFAPRSGAFFARTKDAFLRSDDGGASWRQVSLPANAKIAGVDPTNHTILYAAGPAGLYKTADDAASWQLIVSTDAGVGPLAISPVDHNLLYLTLLTGNSVRRNGYFFRRSRDGGVSWQELEGSDNPVSCGYSTLILQADPSDVNQVYRARSCYSGSTHDVTMQHSTDQGATWSDLLHVDGEEIARLVGMASGRMYAIGNAGNAMASGPNSSLLRTDDGGNTWQEVLPLPGNWSHGVRDDQGNLVLDDQGHAVSVPLHVVRIHALTYDPAQPDRVYLARDEASQIQASTDGGLTWTDAGQREFSAVNDLTVGIDGRNLYAATDEGVWRLGLE
jgi:photosystem II stability/assembly factor-like uncharacterized protein